MEQKNKSRFRIIIILLIILLVGLIGWFVITPMFKDKPASTNTPPGNTVDSDTNGGTTKYLSIKEWGVKFSLTVETADAYYDTKTSSPLDSMSLRSHSLDSEPDCTNAPQSVATIFRVPKDAEDESLPGKKYNETQDGKTIGDYFYFIQSSQYSCTETQDEQILLQGIRNSFNTAGPTIQKVE